MEFSSQGDGEGQPSDHSAEGPGTGTGGALASSPTVLPAGTDHSAATSGRRHYHRSVARVGVQVVRAGDPDPWRNRVREAIGRRNRPTLEALVEFARLCYYKQLYSTSIRLYEQAFTTTPALAWIPTGAAGPNQLA